MKTREQLEHEYSEAIDCGDFYKAQDIVDDLKALNTHNQQQITNDSIQGITQD